MFSSLTVLISTATLFTIATSDGDAAFTYCTTQASVTDYGFDLGTTVLSGTESLQFYTIGDWGVVGCDRDDCDGELATDLASQFGIYAGYPENGDNVKFTVNVGDNFYQKGNDGSAEALQRWNTTFENIFSDESLQSQYFYSILGNHDWKPNEENSSVIGTKTQIDYTSNTILNENKRWCMPSYYYNYSYVLDTFSVGFIALDAMSILTYENGGCGSRGPNNELNEICNGGVDIPSVSTQMEWFESTLEWYEDAHDYTVVYSHYPIVSAGKYGVNTTGYRDFNGNGSEVMVDPKCESVGPGVGGFERFSLNISNLLAQYGVQLYISGHEHHSEMFVGNYSYDMSAGSGESSGSDDRVEIISLLSGSFGKTDGIKCGVQSDIDEQFNSDDARLIKWMMVDDILKAGFGHVVIDKDGISTKIVDSELDVILEAYVANRDSNGDSGDSSDSSDSGDDSGDSGDDSGAVYGYNYGVLDALFVMVVAVGCSILLF